MRIGELAAQAGVNPKTIRYYESIGLLPEPDRTDAGYRVYGADDIDRLAFIRRAQQLDLSLDEIAEILAMRERGEQPCSYVLDVARARLEELDRRIADMERARAELDSLLQDARGPSADDGSYCQLIQHQRAAVPTTGRPHNDSGDQIVRTAPRARRPFPLPAAE